MSDAPSIETSDSHPGVLVAAGEWTLANSARMLELLRSAPASAVDIDGRDITRLDSAGAMMLSRYAVKVGLGLATVEVQARRQLGDERGAGFVDRMADRDGFVHPRKHA